MRVKSGGVVCNLHPESTLQAATLSWATQWARVARVARVASCEARGGIETAAEISSVIETLSASFLSLAASETASVAWKFSMLKGAASRRCRLRVSGELSNSDNSRRIRRRQPDKYGMTLFNCSPVMSAVRGNWG